MEKEMTRNGAVESSGMTIKGILSLLMEETVDNNNGKRVISLGMGDPCAYSCFRTTQIAQDAVMDALRSLNFNGYAPTSGLPQTRRAIAEYLSRDLVSKLWWEDVFITSGCTQAIDVALSILARPGANILIPRPGFPIYQLTAAFRGLEVRHYDLIPHNAWEVDFDQLESLADHNTVAVVIINPGNPCGNVYSHYHLSQIAECCKKLKTVVVADEVYGHLAFGDTPFVPMGRFASICPVITLGSLSKRWIVPGWRLGWFVINDPSAIFRTPKIVERIKKYFDILGGPATFIQAAVPRIMEQTDEEFFENTLDILKRSSRICCTRIRDIPSLTIPGGEPHGSMAMMVKLNLGMLKDITDDLDFCFKLVKEESVVLLPGLTVGLKNWIRITFAADPSSVDEALSRIKSFCHRHSSSSAS